MRTTVPSPSGRRLGLLLALAAACVSGLTVFLNGYAVKHVHTTPTVYTTAKNLVAAVVLALGFLASGAVSTRRSPVPSGRAPRSVWVGVGYVGLVGGGLAFALFFDGLSKTSATTAAFVQKSLVVWVIVLAVPLLRERVRAPQWSAVALLVAGVAVLNGGVGTLRGDKGPALVLAATLLWAVETVVAKRLLGWLTPATVGLARMGIGSVALLGWLAANAGLARLAHLGPNAWAWVLLTGALLAVYVGLWFAALARAQAVDVTAVLVFGAFVTAALGAGVQGTRLPNAWGLVPVAAGVIVLAATWPRRRAAPAEGAAQ